jgi:hypothetical protein
MVRRFQVFSGMIVTLIGCRPQNCSQKYALPCGYLTSQNFIMFNSIEPILITNLTTMSKGIKGGVTI